MDNSTRQVGSRSNASGWLIFLLFLVPFSPSPALAQTEQEVLEQIRHTLQLEEQRRAEERRIREEQQRTHTIIPSETLDLPDLDTPGEYCFTVAQIEIEGVTLFSDRQIRAITQPLVDTCVGIAEINGLVGRLTNLYIDAGYVTSRAYIPAQDLGSGTLLIRVIEGYVESLRIEGGPPRLLATALPGLVGKPLNLREIEQGLDQINRLQSSQATIQFVPGEEVGATEVVIVYRQQRTSSLGIGYNNSGQKSTGEKKVSLNLGHDNLLGINDFIYVNFQGNAPGEGEGKASDSYALHYSAPMGYWLFSLDYNQFEYLNRIQGSATVFDTSGDNEVWQLGVDRLLHRNQKSKTTLKAAVKHQSSDNFIDDIRLDTSSRESVTASLDISREYYLHNGSILTTSLGYEQGLRSKDGIDRTEDIDSPEGKFQKYRFNVGLAGNTGWLGYFWRWRTDLRGQYSDDVLFSSEAISIGSLYSVRGFKTASLYGDSGAWWRNELSLVTAPFSAASDVRVEPFLGADAGYVDSGDSLAGAALGVRMSGLNLSLILTYAKPLYKPDDFSVDSHSLDFSLSFNKRW